MVHEICETAIILREAVSAADLVLQDVQKLTSLQETRGMSLPVQRKTGDIKIAWGELLLEIFRFHARETSALQLEDQREGFVLKMELVKLSSIAEEMRVGKKSCPLIPDSSSRAPIRYITSRLVTKCHTSISCRNRESRTNSGPSQALNKKYMDLAGVASLELVECFGQYDPAITSRFLALYQSYVTSTHIIDLLICRPA
ncbi:hypothetical protein MAR_004816 [Mya arenaria]|uniref:Uncharacterized protein n=1 Tax=Mya arenaria TaxID=6604 RepID=A0ABY7F5X8_MYAAR|nr:hypothetical protein MAR_004816 [Mya arenaria]